MSIKSLIQIFILFLIILIVGFVYFEYFDIRKNVVMVENTNSTNDINKNQIMELEKEIINLKEKNIKLNDQLNNKKTKSEKLDNENLKNNKKKDVSDKEKIDNNTKLRGENEKTISKKSKIKNLVKDVEYISMDNRGNKFYLLATTGKSNIKNNNILDLENVRGNIKSDKRDTIYIVSDYAQYNSINLNSKFYENVIINYQDKEITCINFDINMETNMAIAYNDVVITDTKSIMKAGIVEFDLKTKNININPETSTSQIEVIAN
tara:strand:+ start:4150 stop:4941 length:792 start_codon:yes stop_codon:yes gene_type:complete